MSLKSRLNYSNWRGCFLISSECLWHVHVLWSPAEEQGDPFSGRLNCVSRQKICQRPNPIPVNGVLFGNRVSADVFRQCFPRFVVIQSLSFVWLFYDSMDYSLPCSSFHGILQARILEQATISFSRDLPNPEIELASPALAGGFFTTGLD